MKFATFTLHEFRNDWARYPFDPIMYSKFKHGSISAAKQMGEELAIGFFKDYKPLEHLDKQIVVFPSPYFFIPSAAALMTKYFLQEFNRLRAHSHKKPAVMSHIMRELTYHTDYGKMGVKERAKLIAGDRFYVDHEYLKDKHTLHIDDIRITGSHEVEIVKLLGQTSTDFTCVYYAGDKTQDPKTEDKLNNYAIRGPKDIFKILTDEECVYNVRNMRVLLTLDTKVFQDYVCFTDSSKLIKFYDLAIGNLYHEVDIYQQNIQILKVYLGL